MLGASSKPMNVPAPETAFALWTRLSSWQARTPERAAVLEPGRPTLTWRDLLPSVDAFATVLSAAGLTAESRIAVSLPPGADAPLVCLAAMKVGIAVPLDPELGPVGLGSTLAHLRPHLLVTRPGMPGDAAATAARCGVPVVWVDWKGSDPVGSVRATAPVPVARTATDDEPLRAPAGTRLILQTSGSTARPKLVPLTEINLTAAAEALIASLCLTEHDRGLNLLPQFHIGGIWDLLAGPLMSGGSVICGGTYSTLALARGMALSPTWLQLVPAMLRAMLDTSNGRVTEDEPSTLRFIRAVSASLPPSLRSEAQARLGVPIVEIYGMTETAGVIASEPVDPARQRAGAVGLVVGPQATIRDAEGRELGTGMEGEVVLRGAAVTPGYLDGDPIDAAAFQPFGLRSGDLGRLDADGRLWLTGRRKDVVNRGGEKISPSEVDAALMSLPWVEDAAAFALPHPVLGEELGAAIVAAEPGDPDAVIRRTREALLGLLGHAKRPASMVIVDAIPRTAGGKLQRHLLTERFATMARATPRHGAGVTGWPAAPVARWIARTWANVLGLSIVGPDDDFIGLGGTSLQAAHAVSILQQLAAHDIVYVSSVYEAPTPVRYEDFLRHHHPNLVAYILGQALLPDRTGPDPVTPTMSSAFRRAIAQPLDPSQVPGPAPLLRPAIFILSSPRSGSTLLRAMLAGHPALFAPPELYLLSHADLTDRRRWYGTAHASQLEGLPRAVMGALGCSAGEASRRLAALESQGLSSISVYGVLQDWIGDRTLVDKTPFYSVHASVLAAAESAFEQPRYIHLHRHPYGMIRSFERSNMAQLWWPRLTGPTGLGTRCDLHPRQLAELLWCHIHATIGLALASVPSERRLSVRYEDLVRDPEAEGGRICEFLGIPFDRALLSPLDDPPGRMTDGLHAESRMMGDPLFHSHRAIESGAADRWRSEEMSDFLAEDTWRIAADLGHHERLLRDRDRVELTL